MTRSRRRCGRGRLLACAALAGATAAPLPAQEAERDLRRFGWQPHPAQAEFCSWEPERLPLLESVVDETAVVEAAQRIPGFEDAGNHYVVSIALDSTGAVSGITSIESTFAPEREPEFLDLVVPHVLPRPSEGTGRLRLGVFGGADLAVVLGPAHSCEPMLANRRTVGRILTNLGTGRRTRLGTATVSLYVQPNGVPTEFRLDESSGDGSLDAKAMAVAEEMRFLPARIEGVPMAVWVSLPLSIGTGR